MKAEQPALVCTWPPLLANLSAHSCRCPAGRQRDAEGREYLDEALIDAGPMQVRPKATAVAAHTWPASKFQQAWHAQAWFVTRRQTRVPRERKRAAPPCTQAARLLNERHPRSPTASPRPGSPRIKPPLRVSACEHVG